MDAAQKARDALGPPTTLDSMRAALLAERLALADGAVHFGLLADHYSKTVLMAGGSLLYGILTASIGVSAHTGDGTVGSVETLVQDADGRIYAVVGFRLAAGSALFLEQYLDDPVETAVGSAWAPRRRRQSCGVISIWRCRKTRWSGFEGGPRGHRMIP